MKDTKFVSLAQTFSKEEWLSFRTFLLMKTRVGSDNYAVFAFLQKRKHKLDQLERTEDIRLQYFAEWNQKYLLNLLSRLHMWAEEWLVYRANKRDKLKSEVTLVRELNRRGNFHLADIKARKLILQIEKDEISIENKRLLADLYYAIYYSDNPAKRKSNILTKLAQTTLEAEESKRQLVLCELRNMNQQNKKYDDLIKGLSIKSVLHRESELGYILNSLQQLIESKSIEHFNILKTALTSGQIKRGSDLEILICLYLFNYSFVLHSNSILTSTKDIIDITNYGLEHQILNPGGILSASRYVNIVIALSKSSDQNSVLDFIDKWTKSVGSEDLESMQALGKALLYTIKRKYDRIIIHPTLFQYSDIYLKLHAQSLYIVYCISLVDINFDAVHDSLSNLKRTLRRYKKELSKDYYLAYINFSKVIYDASRQKKINLNQYQRLMHKEWLLEQYG